MTARISPSADFLRTALLADAVATGAAALVSVALAGPLATWLEVPRTLLIATGLVLIPWVAYLLLLSRRVSSSGVWTVILGNLAWAVGCVVLAWLVAPNAFGYAFLLAQAGVVAAFAEPQYVGLRRAQLTSAREGVSSLRG